MEPFGDLNWPLMDNNIDRQDLDCLIRFLESNPRLTQSSNVLAFEEEWSRWLGVKHSVFVNSGSSANLITLAALRHLYGMGEVILPPFTWVSDVAAVLQNGFTPVFADINPRTLCMDDEKVIENISPNTRAVFMTHAQGFHGLTDRLLTVLEEKKIPLIEDVCEAHGATFKGRRAGSFGLASNFSFYFAHHMSTVEGGMVSTNCGELYQILRMLRSHGMVREMTDPKMKEAFVSGHPDLNPDFIFAFPAYNVRNTEMGAVLGRSQLKRLDHGNERRKSNFKLFLNRLDKKKYRTDFDLEGSCNYALNLVLKHPDSGLREQVEEVLRGSGVEFRRGSSGGGNQLRQPYMKKMLRDRVWENYPETEHIHFWGYYLGNYPGLSPDKIKSLCCRLNGLEPARGL